MCKKITFLSLLVGVMFMLGGCFLFEPEDLVGLTPDVGEEEDPLMEEIDFFVENAVTDDEDQEDEEEEEEVPIEIVFPGNWVMTLDVEGTPVVSELYAHPGSLDDYDHYYGTIDTIRSYIAGEVLSSKAGSANYEIDGQRIDITAHDASSSFTGTIHLDGSKPYVLGTFYFTTGQSGPWSMEKQD